MTVTGSPETTFADLRRGGLRGLLDQALADRPGLTDHQRSVVTQSLGSPAWVNACNALDQVVGGNPHPTDHALAALADVALVSELLAGVATRAAELIASTPSAVVKRHLPFARVAGHEHRREFNAD